jgi:hypothetical protein
MLTSKKIHELQHLDFLTFSFDSIERKSMFKKDPRDKLRIINKMSRRYDIIPSAILTITSKNIDMIIPAIKILNQNKISCLLSLIHSDNDSNDNKDRGKKLTENNRGYDFRSYTPELEFKTAEDIRKLISLQKSLIRMKNQGFRIAERKEYIMNMVNYAKGKYRIRCPAADPFMTIDCDGYIKACHDCLPSRINALNFKDYDKMKKELKNTIPKDCTCYYDCYFNHQFGKLNSFRRYLEKR